MAVSVKVKKWGNSMGIILPKELVEERNLKINDEIAIEIFKTLDLSAIFGSLKTKIDAQKMKDEAREGWEPERKKKLFERQMKKWKHTS